ncbi:hypothetical protein EYF80_062924 [Liparis tanakae]|uniref:Uncharacterized protein n=1 Tax=Liparis tanakae TaxID=230148 RepID=A0A4Z2EEL2_9TELE|nr:hypothetical protein EYF80_062924 [Liparis tanakae]
MEKTSEKNTRRHSDVGGLPEPPLIDDAAGIASARVVCVYGAAAAWADPRKIDRLPVAFTLSLPAAYIVCGGEQSVSGGEEKKKQKLKESELKIRC